MSQRPISLSPDLQKLRGEGYDLEICSGFLLVKSVPFVSAGKQVKRGVLVCQLALAGDITARPGDHVAHFIGDHPCRDDGREIEQIKHQSRNQKLADGVEIDHTFSAKPKPADNYDDYYHKVTTYVAMFERYAQVIEPQATAKTFPVIEPDQDDPGAVFNYIDSASSRAEIGMATKKLEARKIAIVGLGGTGSYVLDLVAKTPVREIHLFDGDEFLQHNAFRSPGASSIEELRAKPKKAAYFKALYSKMHRGIIDHGAYLHAGNIEQLKGMDFVFLSFDRGTSKKLIIACLQEFAVPFVDVGMGVYLAGDALGGVLRVTTVTVAKHDHLQARIPFSDGDGNNEYAKNIQIADLNALNAALAVIKWKKVCGFYSDLDREHHCTYTIDGNALFNEERQP
jgi:ThiF family